MGLVLPIKQAQLKLLSFYALLLADAESYDLAALQYPCLVTGPLILKVSDTAKPFCLPHCL